MPFTLSHPAAVLPFRRLCGQRVYFVALIIGSMTPDTGYFIGRFSRASFAHTIPGSFVICLPTGVLLLVMMLLSRPLRHVLPWPHREAFCLDEEVRVGAIPVILLCLLLGAWTHIFWDSFTHQTGYFVQRISWLRDTGLTVKGIRFPMFYLLQQISTIVGGLLVLRAYRRWMKRQTIAARDGEKTDAPGYLALGITFGLSLCVAIAGGWYTSRMFHGFLAFRVFAFRATIFFLDVFILSIILASILVWLARRRAA